MSICPLCYGLVEANECAKCYTKMSSSEWTKLEAATYRSIVTHLRTNDDERRREQIRTKIALKNIRGWAKENKEMLDESKDLYNLDPSVLF